MVCGGSGCIWVSWTWSILGTSKLVDEIIKSDYFILCFSGSKHLKVKNLN